MSVNCVNTEKLKKNIMKMTLQIIKIVFVQKQENGKFSLNNGIMKHHNV